VDSSSHVERTVLAERSNFFEFHWPNQWLTNFSYAMKDALKDALLPIAGEKCRLMRFPSDFRGTVGFLLRRFTSFT